MQLVVLWAQLEAQKWSDNAQQCPESDYGFGFLKVSVSIISPTKNRIATFRRPFP
jgi:hypothetical protein